MSKFIFNTTRITPVSVFSIAAIVLFCSYLFIKPPMTGPDELNHFFRAYQVSEGTFLPENVNNRLGGSLPLCVQEVDGRYRPFTYIDDYKFTRQTYLALFDIPSSSKGRCFLDFPNTSYYSAVNYIPYAVPLYIARKLQVSLAWGYYGGKILMFLLFFFGMRFSIKTMPFLQWSFCLLALLPMQQYVLNSISIDPLTTVLSAMSFAMLMHVIYVAEVVSRKTLFLFLILALTLSSGKLIYSALFFPLVLIPVSKFGNLAKKITSLACIAILVLLTAGFWSSLVKINYISYANYNPEFRANSAINPTADLLQQQQFVRTQYAALPTIIKATFIKNAEFYPRSFVGGLGAFIEVQQSYAQSVTALLLLVILAFSGSGTKIPLLHKLLYLLVGCLLVVGTLLSQFLLWTPVGSPEIEGVQGRYFYPVLAFFLVIFSSPKKLVSWAGLVITIIAAIYLNGIALQNLAKRYFDDHYKHFYSFSTDFETNSKRTDVSPVSNLNYASDTAHSGKHSLRILPSEKVILPQRFSSVFYGDMTTVSAWVKGGSAEIGFDGNGVDCEGLKINHSTLGFSTDSGWGRLLMHYTMYPHCKQDTLWFTIENKSTVPIYVDDINIDIKRDVGASK